MQHIAIMKKSWKLVPKILSGEKTIESRWYKYRFSPWNKIKPGDIVYFKNTGEPVTVVAKVLKVLQFEDLDKRIFQQIMEKYGDKIGINNREYSEYYRSKRYCILIFLKNVKKLDKPFHINKSGFGNSTAWITVEDVKKLKVNA